MILNKEREMNRKNTPITKFRKGSAKRSKQNKVTYREREEQYTKNAEA